MLINGSLFTTKWLRILFQSLLMNDKDIDPDVPVAILLNKTDIPTAVGEEFMADQLAILQIRTGKVRNNASLRACAGKNNITWTILAACVYTGPSPK